MTWPARLTRIDQRRRALAGAGVPEPALTMLSADDSVSPHDVRRAVADAAARGLTAGEVGEAVLRLGGVAVAVRVAPVAEVETPHQRAHRELVERLGSAVARRRVLGKVVDERDLLDRFGPMLAASVRALGVDDPAAVEAECGALWSSAWAEVVDAR